MAMGSLLLFFLFSAAALSIFCLFPLKTKHKLKKSGFNGPPPNFPFGNLKQMGRATKGTTPTTTSPHTDHDIHSQVFPYFSLWKKAHGKIFVYWLGTEPFLYVAEPEFLKKVLSGALGKKWGKPGVFRQDRKPMFGNGLVMAEGDDWAHHRQIITPAFSMTNMNGMVSLMVETTSKMLENWKYNLSTNSHEIDVEKDIIWNAAEIIAKATFGISQQIGKLVFGKLQALQAKLFRPNHLIGVPLSKLLRPKHTYEAQKLGEEIDQLLFAIIESRMKEGASSYNNGTHSDLLGFLLARNMESSAQFTPRELVDECKTFFFGGHETTALALTWTLFLLALYPEWQETLREEVMEVTGGRPLDSAMLSKLTKMEWVFNEVMRLYPSAPNAQRQAIEDICVEDIVIPKGTNMWIDIVGMNHDLALWGDDVNEFRPERFKESVNGGCKHRMGFSPFGFGARACVGRNLTMLEYRIVISLILREFSMSVSPSYLHSPRFMLTLRPSHGMPLIFHRID